MWKAAGVAMAERERSVLPDVLGLGSLERGDTVIKFPGATCSEPPRGLRLPGTLAGAPGSIRIAPLYCFYFRGFLQGL